MIKSDKEGTLNAISRLSGCPVSHLSLSEASLIQAIRERNMSNEDIALLADIVKEIPPHIRMRGGLINK